MSDLSLRADPKSLEEAQRQLAMLEDVCIDEAGEVPAWVRAARTAVSHARQEVDQDEA
jgi:hypothetical protein